MATLERVNTMRSQGMSDMQIVNSLKEEGISPIEINEALSQSQIKSAISNDVGMQPSMMQEANQQQQYMSVPEARGNNSTQAYGQRYAQEAQEPAPAAAPVYQEPAYPPQQQYADQNAYPQQQYADQTAYAQQGYDQQAGYYSQGLDFETVKDISKQQVEESLKKIREEILPLTKLKTELKFEMQDMENRLAQVESVIHELQTAIIRKIGDYGESIANISKEVRATQNSFAKVINPLMDKKRGYSEKEEETGEEPEEPKLQKSSEKKSSRGKPVPKTERGGAQSGTFEDYFR